MSIELAADAPKILALDGPAGAGKSTVARLVGESLGLTVLDTGAMYRAITIACTARAVDLNDARACAEVGRDCVLELRDDGQVLLDGRDVTAEVRTPHVTSTVSTISAHREVREIMVAHQREWARHHGSGVVEGRDIGTVVFPEAPLKIFLVASPDERARRRSLDEVAAGRTVDLTALIADIERRDRADSQRIESPLRPAADAIMVDTTGRSIDDVVAEIVGRYETLP